MKTAISIPDPDFARIEKVAAQNGMNRSTFFRLAAMKFADELEGGAILTRIADAAIAAAGQPSEDGLFQAEATRIISEGADR